MQEHTQRSRSFLLAAMATVAAQLERSDRVRFYENGIMSVNLPISTQVVGTRASRSTHPRSLMLLEDLARLVGLRDVKIDNPFIWKTKVEVVQELNDRARGRLHREHTELLANARHDPLQASLWQMCTMLAASDFDTRGARPPTLTLRRLTPSIF